MEEEVSGTSQSSEGLFIPDLLTPLSALVFQLRKEQLYGEMNNFQMNLHFALSLSVDHRSVRVEANALEPGTCSHFVIAVPS